MEMACNLFEGGDHPTIAGTPGTHVGFVHGLGHGIDLTVHEEPFFALSPANLTVLRPGHVFTREPGLHDPDGGYCVRIEDVIWIDADGAAQDLTDSSKELVIPV
jgi:Xaa-Pro aminopeptidase